MAKKSKPEVMEIAGRQVKISSPDKVYFPRAGITKLDLVRYYLSVGEGALRGVHDRPIVLKRYVNGIEEDFFFQKRAPKSRPSWIRTATLAFPSGRTADEVVAQDLATLIWCVNLGCVDLNPHPIRADDLDHPDELRVDLDPGPGVPWSQVRQVAMVVEQVLTDHQLQGWPKTSGSRGIHINVRIERRWTFAEVRRAALALAREVERRAPAIATSRWFKEERHGVFLDYNQNAKDRTVASAYSVRPVPEAWVSAPLRWDEVPDAELGDFTLRTMPARFAELGDVSSGIDEAAGSLESLLELSARQEAPGRSKMPLIVVAKAAKKDDAVAGLKRWKQRHPRAAEHVRTEDVLIDAMRGRYTTWTRVRINLRHVPAELRPDQEPPDPDYDPWQGS